MGNLNYQSICTPTHPFRQTFKKSFSPVGHIIHPRFGSIDLFKDNKSNKTSVFVKQMQFQSKLELVSMAKKLSRRLASTHPNLLQVYDFMGSEVDETCGTHNTMRIFVEYVQGSIRREIKHRTKYKSYGFTEQQLQKILHEILLGLSYLHQNKQFHGQIKMSDILIGNNNQIKLIDKAISVTSFQIGQQGQSVSIIKGKGILFAPTIMRCLENKKTQINSYDPFKGDIFSVGMVMLECASLQESELCYDYERCVIDRERINHLIAQLKSHYSPRFIVIIESMLVEYDEQRPSARQVLAWIRQFQRTKTSSISSISEPLLLGDTENINITFS